MAVLAASCGAMNSTEKLSYIERHTTFDCSDGRVVRAFAPAAVDSGLISSRAKPTTVQLVFTASLFDAALNGVCIAATITSI